MSGQASSARCVLRKTPSTFCYPEHISRELRRVFAWLRERSYLRDLSSDEFTRDAAHFLAEINAIHPFREGNGRTQLTFLALLAERAGQPLDLDKLDAAAMLHAMIRSFNADEAPLAAIIAILIT